MASTRAQLLALMAVKFPDNHQGLITPAFARSFFTELVNSVCLYNQLDQQIESGSGFFSLAAFADGTDGSNPLGDFTVDSGLGPFQQGVNNAAITITAPIVDAAKSGSCQIGITNGAAAGLITLAGYTMVAGTPTLTQDEVWMLTTVRIAAACYGSWTQIA